MSTTSAPRDFWREQARRCGITTARSGELVQPLDEWMPADTLTAHTGEYYSLAGWMADSLAGTGAVVLVETFGCATFQDGGRYGVAFRRWTLTR